mgnify:CR=1 FL=1
MKWKNRRASSNIEDNRRVKIGRGAKGGGLITIVVVLAAMYFGVDPQIAKQIANANQLRQKMN